MLQLHISLSLSTPVDFYEKQQVPPDEAYSAARGYQEL